MAQFTSSGQTPGQDIIDRMNLDQSVEQAGFGRVLRAEGDGTTWLAIAFDGRRFRIIEYTVKGRAVNVVSVEDGPFDAAEFFEGALPGFVFVA